MKFTPEVVAALEVLRAAAENDFERHRLNVLEHDLREPPVVEQADDTHQKFNGVSYALRKRSGHFYGQMGVHQAVWQYYNGDIPEGRVIHHVDRNPANNSIENLQCLTATEHTRIHHPNNVNFQLRLPFVCKICGKTFYAYNSGTNSYCSTHCASIASEKQRSDLILGNCLFCGKKFVGRGNRNAKYCSVVCANKARAKIKVIKKCIVCGQDFETTKNSGRLYCSDKCRQNRKSKESKC